MKDFYISQWDFPGCSDGRGSTYNVGDPGQEDPLEKGGQPAPVFLPGEPHGRRSLVGYSPWGRKELDTTEQTHTYISVEALLTGVTCVKL